MNQHPTIKYISVSNKQKIVRDKKVLISTDYSANAADLLDGGPHFIKDQKVHLYILHVI